MCECAFEIQTESLNGLTVRWHYDRCRLQSFWIERLNAERKQKKAKEKLDAVQAHDNQFDNSDNSNDSPQSTASWGDR